MIFQRDKTTINLQLPFIDALSIEKNTLHMPSDPWQIYIKLSNFKVNLLKTV